MNRVAPAPSTPLPAAAFPRVLFVTPVAFNPFSGGGATFASLFQGWPKARLATVHNDPSPTSLSVCEHYYVLAPQDLDFVVPFSYLRRRRSGYDGTGQRKKDGQAAPAANNARSYLVERARHALLGDSIPERAHLRPPLERWIGAFAPDLLYTSLGSNGMMSLVEQIRFRFKLPLVVHIMDDWASSVHRFGLFAPLERRRMLRWLDHFFDTSASCLGICPAMCEAYAARYGRDFLPFQYALDATRWSAVTKQSLEPAAVPEFLYVGSIFPDAQLQSLIDFARAFAELKAEGFSARLRIATSAANRDRFRHLLEVADNVGIEASALDDAAFFQTLADADALLLPVNFDPTSVDFIRYSMPTKIPAYLNSGTPILVYGAAESAQVRYAMDAGWGLVVSQPSPAALKAGIMRIARDMALRRQLSTAARRSAANHDAAVVRQAFQSHLCGLVT